MFERYTERARRVLFFARFEASQLGNISIETEHLLLGLIREKKGLANQVLASHVPLEDIRKDIEGRTAFRENVPTSVEIPFSADTKRVLQYAADEADRLLHNYIGTEHLLLGLLREESSVANSILREHGFDLASVRTEISRMLQTTSDADSDDRRDVERTNRADVVKELEQVKVLVDRLASQLSDQHAAKPIIEQISFYLERLRGRFRQ
jgi:ATP-dependent Clp protease ATP-binding subunit ClpC